MAIITLPTTGQTVSAFTPGAVSGLVFKCAESILNGADITLKYPQFETTLDQWGEFIEEARVPATESHAVNKYGTAIPHYYFDLDAMYFKTWTEKQYTKEIRRTDCMKVLSGEMAFSDLLAKVIMANVEGYRNETNQGIRNTFLSTNSDDANKALLQGTPTGDSLTGAIPGGFLRTSSRFEALGDAATPATYEEIYSEIMFRCKDMTFPNATYTSGTNIYGAEMTDLCIIMPIDFLSHASIEFTSKLYNLSEIGKLPEIIETDSLSMAYNTGANTPNKLNAIIIMDKRVIRHVVKEFETPEPWYNRESRSDYFDLNVVDMIRVLPFYKAWAIVFDSTNR